MSSQNYPSNKTKPDSWRRRNARRTFRFINSIVLVVSVISYLSVLVSPQFFWLFGFVSMLIPFCLMANVFFVLLWWWRKRWYALYSLLVLVIGFPFWQASISFGGLLEEDFEENRNYLSVLSYNVREFDVYQRKNDDYTVTKNTINWIKNDTSDIICIQDFYNSETHTVLNTREQLAKEKTETPYYFHKRYTSANHGRGKFGIAIFSKYPFINKGEVPFKVRTANGAIFADIVKNNDTIRIYNIHLESMSINQNELQPLDKPEETFWYAGSRLKKGFASRAEQVEAIINHIQASPYPIILCGDLNDLPYSYTYFKLHHSLENAFESKGLGTGFTFNGKLFFLRIDNQFYDEEKIECLYFNTHREIPFSDHYPVRGIYSIK
ncbi:endonuclease/exonuclease/phosphatase family protein [Bernardetia sp.]|uniref:endonuclease/exonuclease/phosphatase family protein n=1 Tax=Bernardetia sp. TaxID=1937974 RepID=UPI0025C1C06D|nr:endonuclease/exonuclease/phosphatase family protein [Bernardetia sp.]